MGTVTWVDGTDDQRKAATRAAYDAMLAAAARYADCKAAEAARLVRDALPNAATVVFQVTRHGDVDPDTILVSARSAEGDALWHVVGVDEFPGGNAWRLRVEGLLAEAQDAADPFEFVSDDEERAETEEGYEPPQSPLRRLDIRRALQVAIDNEQEVNG